MAQISNEEADLLKKFRERLSEVYFSVGEEADYDLVRWLRARNNNLDAAEDMFRKALAFRLENPVDPSFSLKPDNPWNPDVVKRFSVHIGTDKDNCPYYLLPTGRFPFQEAVADAGLSDTFLKLQLFRTEAIVKSMKGKRTIQDNLPVTNMTIIHDLKNLSFQTVLNISIIRLFSAFVRQYDANFPERAKTIVFINASKYLAAVLRIVKPLTAEKTFSKIMVVTEDKVEEVLRSLIPKEELPLVYGGTNEDSPLNEYCRI